MDILFILSFLLYFILGYKVNYWRYISKLGFKSEAPIIFIINQKKYHLATNILLAVAFFSLFGTISIPCVLGLPALGVASVATGYFAGISAAKKYKEIINELANEETDTKAKNDMLNEANKSIGDIISMINKENEIDRLLRKCSNR